MARRGWDDQERAYERGAYSHPPGGQLRPRRPQPAPLVSRTFRGEPFRLVVSAVIGVAGVVTGTVALGLGEIEGLLLLGGGCWAMSVAIWTPHRVTLEDSGVLLEAVVRRIRIPWDELESVAPPWWDVRHEALKWRRSQGLAVVTLQAFPDLHRMLVEIEQQSPRTYVSS